MSRADWYTVILFAIGGVLYAINRSGGLSNVVSIVSGQASPEPLTGGGSSSAGGDGTPTGLDGLSTLARAIATAEGYGVPGAIPTRANNPGDLVEPWTGYPTLGSENITVFPDTATGWAALLSQLTLIQTGGSTVYTPAMTMQQFAATWTTTQQSAWLNNVLAYLQNAGFSVDASTALGDVLNG